MSEVFRVATVLLGDGSGTGKFLTVGMCTDEQLRAHLEVNQTIVASKDWISSVNGKHSFSTAEVRDARTRITAITCEMARRCA